MADPTIVFKVERIDSTLVVLPQGPALQFNNNEVHLETNALYRLLDERELRDVIVDLQSVDYVDSVIISSVLRCLTKTKQRRGKAVFCNASVNMTQLLKTIRIGKLWPSFDNRDDAIAAIAAE
jgi:anti-anti-sigma factor